MSWMAYAAPSRINKEKISEAMALTYKERREWIDKESPSCTDICVRYKHFINYEGEMVSFFLELNLISL